MQQNSIPQHIGIIMDGNRRWAKKRNLLSYEGHKEGSKKLEPIVSYAAQKGIPYITFWAFSTENWKRSAIEKRILINIFRFFLHDSVITRLIDKGVRLQVLGDITAFPKDIQKDFLAIIDKSKKNNVTQVNIGLNYGGRQEILMAVNTLLNKIPRPSDTPFNKGGKGDFGLITEEEFSSYLYTNGTPDPDLIIRTGGEQRLSGFMPWQSIYSELYFTETFWPDFDEKEFQKALDYYAQRERRIGK